MRIVAVDNATPELGVDGFVLDNRRAAELAVSHLIDLGHRRIGIVAGMRHQKVSQERLAGYRETLRRARIRVAEALVTHGDFRLEEARACTEQLLALKPRPTAIFVANNLMLIGVMRALAEAGIRVPRDISVCSIDDFPWAPAFQPSLTVVRQPIAEMAAAAVARLVDQLGEERSASIEERVFAPELVIRDSCERLKAADAA